MNALVPHRCRFPLFHYLPNRQFAPVSENMVNVYCGSLDSFFAQMVSYGILKDADAQCFSVQGYIDPGSISLLVAAILLAILNSVVSLASNQLLAEQDRRQERSNPSESEVVEESAKEGNQSSGSQTSGSSQERQNGDVLGEETKIRPLPIIFTDAYGWLLHSGNTDDVVSA